MATYSIKRRNFIPLVNGLTRPLRARGRVCLAHFNHICNSLKEGHMPLSHSASAILFGAWLVIGVPMSASANVITDWDEKAVAVVMPGGPVGVSQQV